MKEELIEEIEGLKQAAKLMLITNDITHTGLNALNAGLDALIDEVKNLSSNNVLAEVKSFTCLSPEKNCCYECGDCYFKRTHS
mgnify:CR=1 FL=1